MIIPKRLFQKASVLKETPKKFTMSSNRIESTDKGSFDKQTQEDNSYDSEVSSEDEADWIPKVSNQISRSSKKL